MENIIFDKSNVYKLSKDEFEKVKENPLIDFDESKKKYAEDLYQRIINTGNMPYVLLINDSFGMGKTYFITRFSLYLQNQDIKSMYISIKEQDYINEPLTVILKEIYNCLEKDKFKITNSELVNDIINKIKKINISMSLPFFTNKLKFFGKAILPDLSISCTIGDLVEKERSISDIKNKLAQYIEKEKKKKVALIIDDLDRCDVSYVKRFLEVLKHIFDINGLYVIITGNKCLFEEKCENEDITIIRENYKTKYIDEVINFVKPNYKKIIDEFDLQNKIIFKRLNKYNNKRNSIDELKKEIIYYCEEFNITPRQLKQILNEIVIKIKGIDFEIDLPYLLYKIILQQELKNGNKKQEIMLCHPLSISEFAERRKVFTTRITQSDIKSFNVYNDLTNYFKPYLLGFAYEHDYNNAIAMVDNLITKIEGVNNNLYQNEFTQYHGGFIVSPNDFKQLMLPYFKKKRDDMLKYISDWQIETDENVLKKKYDNLFF